MLKAVVLVSGGGTNLQAIIDKIENGTITNTQLVGVISNKADAYALTRAEKHGIPAVAVPSKETPLLIVPPAFVFLTLFGSQSYPESMLLTLLTNEFLLKLIVFSMLSNSFIH